MRFAIVDGYSTGSALVRALREHGASCVHVRSHPTVPEYFSAGFHPDDYEVDLGYVADRSRLVEALAELTVTRVIAGDGVRRRPRRRLGSRARPARQ